MTKTTWAECIQCGRQLDYEESQSDGPDWCYACQKRYPESLRKASVDTFDFVLKLTTGEVWFFSSCILKGEWVSLIFDNTFDRYPLNVPHKLFPFPRGVDVHVSQIVWCADSPEGS